MLKKELEDVEVVIVDEMSMISSDYLYHLHKRLMEIFDSKDDFGGRALMICGDLLQLPPVHGAPIYATPRSMKYAVWKHMKDQENKPIGDLWQNLEVVVLKTNFRQGEGDPWTNLLNRIRVGEATKEDIEVLESKVVVSGEHELLSKTQYDDATHLFYTNLETFQHNHYKLNTLNSDLIVIEAKCDVPKGSGYIPKINNWGLIDDTNFPKRLEIKVGAKVMLVFNVCIPDKLVNGTFGTVIDVKVTDTGDTEAIIVKFDSPDVGLEQRKELKAIADEYKDQKGCPICKSTTEYYIGRKSKSARKQGKCHGAKCKVTQFPLRLAWACTGHKVQGVTIKKGTNTVVHGHKRMPDGLYYVMLSRAAAKENVFLENFYPEKLKANARSLEEDFKLKERSIVPSYEDLHFSFFVVNIRSLYKHFIDLERDIFAQRSKHICIVETWIEPETTVDFQISGKSFHHASFGKGKGCAVFSESSKQNNNVEIATEKFQLLSFIDGEAQMIVLYLSSNCNLKEVVKTIQEILLPDKVTIIAGDFNFDKDEKNSLTKFLHSKELEHLVNNPTHDGGRTIDNCYVPKNIKHRFQLTTHSPYWTDHDSLCINFV